MKKFTAKITTLKAILAGVLLLGTTSCFESGPATETTTVSKTGQVTRTTTYEHDPDREYHSYEFTIKKLEYEGHTYLYFTEGNGHQAWAGITHDENCKCRKHVQHD